MSPLVLLRAASGPSVGIGHAMRARAVAEAVAARGGRARLIVDDAGTAELLGEASLDATTAAEAGDWAGESASGAWLDGFRDWSREVRGLRAAGTPAVLAENRGPARMLCDRVVYPALHYRADAWDRRNPRRVLAGPEWIPLRGEVLRARRRAARDVGLLVSFGGSDPQRLTERTLGALSGEGLRVAVVVGPHMAARRPAIEALAGRLRDARVLDGARALAPWMARSRRAITALGTTLYELAYLGTPAWILANYASDREALDHYAAHGPHRPLGIASELSDAALAAAIRAALAAPGAGEPPRIAGLGDGAAALARLLLGDAARGPG